MDKTDAAILDIMEQNARISFADLAAEAGLSKSPCWSRVKALETGGTIQGYRAVLNETRLNLRVEAFVDVTIDFAKADDFEAAVLAHPSIMSCHATTGRSDYLLRLVAPDIETFDTLLRKEISSLPGVQRFVTSIATRAIKKNASLVQAARQSGQLP